MFKMPCVLACALCGGRVESKATETCRCYKLRKHIYYLRILLVFISNCATMYDTRQDNICFVEQRHVVSAVASSQTVVQLVLSVC